MSAEATPERTRGRHQTLEGRVVSDKMQKTIVVREDRLVKHPVYGKYVRRKSIYRAHDENNEARVGDVVEISQSRPLSKTKRWRLVRVVRQARLVVGGEEPVA